MNRFIYPKRGNFMSKDNLQVITVGQFFEALVLSRPNHRTRFLNNVFELLNISDAELFSIPDSESLGQIVFSYFYRGPGVTPEQRDFSDEITASNEAKNFMAKLRDLYEIENLEYNYLTCCHSLQQMPFYQQQASLPRPTNNNSPLEAIKTYYRGLQSPLTILFGIKNNVLRSTSLAEAIEILSRRSEIFQGRNDHGASEATLSAIKGGLLGGDLVRAYAGEVSSLEL
jgi:hypothetical protein